MAAVSTPSTEPPTTGLAATTPAASRPPLDDVMLAMDLVDTLSRRERIVRQALDERGRTDDLKAQLKRIYAAQGIEVSDQIIEQGVAALKEERFTYQPPPDSLATKLARIYVRRGTWGKWFGGLTGAGVLAGTIHHFALVAPNAALPGELAGIHHEVIALAQSDDAKAAAQRLLGMGQAALRDEDRKAVKTAIRDLQAMRTALGQEYAIRIVNRPDEMSGIWRIPDMNTGARNFYILVEALDPSGRILTLTIENEETRQTERVTRWGLRVDEETFRAVAEDKRDDGIIERDRFGYKPRGELIPHYEMPTSGRAITRW